MKKSDPTAGLYLHIPFCRRKCLYCDFCSYAGMGADTVEAYVNRLCDELICRSATVKNHTFDTVYFGGGTPTLLSPVQFSRLLDTARSHVALTPDAEITTECNPATVDGHALASLRRAGINRLSIGMQSAADEELRALGRIHTHADTVATVRAARAAGFDNLSLDLMYGIPSQTRDSFARTLDAALSLSPEHVSAYSLILEEGTPFWDVQDTLPLPDEDAVCDMTADALSVLRGAGYERYEISNFALPGRASRHNLHYWRMDDYLGVGIAAHSLVGGVRLQNRPDLAAYLGGEDVSEQEEGLTPAAAMDETLMLGLRLSEGVDKSAFLSRFGMSLDERYGHKTARFVHLGLLVDTPDRLFLTDDGMAVSNTILSDILFE